MTPDPNSPGLIYWFRKPCARQGVEVDFFGKRFEGQLIPRNDNLILDRDNGDLWWFDFPRLGFKPSSSRRNCFSTKANRGMLTSLESWTPPAGEKGP
jgi:hypothetical protein